MRPVRCSETSSLRRIPQRPPLEQSLFFVQIEFAIIQLGHAIRLCIPSTRTTGAGFKPVRVLNAIQGAFTGGVVFS